MASDAIGARIRRSIVRGRRYLGLRTGKKTQGFRLQVILFTALIFLSAVPVILLASWVQTSALNKEIESVAEKHLVIAENLSHALQRYVGDVELALTVAASQVGGDGTRIDVNRYLKSFNFNYVATIDRNDSIVGYQLSPIAGIEGEPLPMEARDYLRSAAPPG